MERSNDFLGTERVGRLMGRYAVPCVISLLVGALYNIVDQIFIANADYLGSCGNAANTVVFPLTVVALSIAVMVGDGCCAFVSMALGRSDLDRARRSVGNIVLSAFCEDLKMTQPRMMAILDPIKLVITNYPEGQVEYLDVPNNQENPEMGTRKVPFARELYIERDDFMIEPPRKYFRLFPGNEVRLMSAYFVTCQDYVTDENGKVTEIHCTYDPETKSGSGFTGRKVKGTIHWVAAPTAATAEVRLYENLVDEEKGVYNEDGSVNINPDSLKVLENCYVEPALAEAKPGDRFQFMRTGYFCVDTKDTTEGHQVFNRIVSMKSSYRPGK